MENGKLLVLFWLVVAITARANDYGDIRVQVENLSPGTHEHGYIEYRAAITNRSNQQTHRVTLRMPAVPDFSSDNALRSMTRTVEVAPQATVTVSLFKPPLEGGGSGLAIVIDGVEQNEVLAAPFSRYEGYRYDLRCRLLISPAIKQSGAMLQAERVLTYASHTSSRTTVQYDALEQPPSKEE